MMRYQRPTSHRHSTGDLHNSTDSLNDRFLSLDRRVEKKVAWLGEEEERAAGKVTNQCDIFRTTETLLEVVLAEQGGMIFLAGVLVQELVRESSQVNIFSPAFLPF